ncbi:Predicted small secreted protein [Prosthecobacter debontii]|uniref:Predicted small secreted protein n=1 Tax=Prosthecobacter debontii TaxID=48467 RepID=A0A1T4WIU8_9BACT|nr:Predicted small secreted protein [Prosthecobacter debontii]
MKTIQDSPAVTSASQDETIAQKLALFVFVFGMLILTTSFLSSCNTTRGLGRDVQKVGNTIERGADRVQANMP